MITVINFAAETQWSTVDESVAFVARIFSDFGCFNARITSMAQCTIVVSYETRIGEFLRTQLTAEALWMPTRSHCFDDASDDNFATFIAIGCKQNAKILFAILASFEFVKDAILKGTETLSAPTSC
jgi:hypothetical protein